jgi:hypothetical protein
LNFGEGGIYLTQELIITALYHSMYQKISWRSPKFKKKLLDVFLFDKNKMVQYCAVNPVHAATKKPLPSTSYTHTMEMEIQFHCRLPIEVHQQQTRKEKLTCNGTKGA